MSENNFEKKSNGAMIAVVLILVAIVGLAALLLFKDKAKPKPTPTPEINSTVTEESKEEKFELTAATFGKEEKITMSIQPGLDKTAVFTLGDYGNYFLYLPEGEWSTDGYDCWFLKENPMVSLAVKKQMYITVEKDMECLATDYEYQILENFENTMFLKEDGLMSIVKVVQAGDENAVFELNYTYPIDGEEQPTALWATGDLWHAIFSTFEVFDMSYLQ
jgi:hypothetical protein